MYIVMVSAECAPVAKAGGLGDFIQGLGRELTVGGHDVEIILPKYDVLREAHIQALTVIQRDLWVPFYDRRIACTIETGIVDGLQCVFIDPQSPQCFFRRGRIYGEADDADRFAFFCRAVLEYLLVSGRHPQIIHCNDWQTGLLPVLLYEIYERLGMNRTRVCYSLHNVGYQGQVTPHVLHMNGLDAAHLLTADRLQDPTNPQLVNLMKGGIVFSNFITTVSPQYAWEIQHTPQGMGLQPLLRQYDHKFGGVLNGIDDATWNPSTDPLIPSHYDVEHLRRKAVNKKALRTRLGLASGTRPIMAVVSRLDRQKGVELIHHAIDYALNEQCQFVLLGSALDPVIDAQFQQAKRDKGANPHCHLALGYNEELAHLIYAGADMILIPSVYEPCGLTQMIAMKYGCIPIVRRVGGLADTVFDANYSDKPFEERNGYVFDELTPAGLESALKRAIGLWYQYPDYFRQLRVNGMRMDNSWRQPGQHYLAIYHHACRDVPT